MEGEGWAQQTPGFDLMLFQYWPTANGAGPTLKQHGVKSSSLQGELSAFGYMRAVCVWLEQATQSSVYKTTDNQVHIFVHYKNINNIYPVRTVD